jgi:hypothetical protein
MPQQSSVDVLMDNRVAVQVAGYVPIGLDDEGISDGAPGPEGLVAREFGDATQQRFVQLQ